MTISAALIGARGTSATATVVTTAGASTGGAKSTGHVTISFDPGTTITSVTDNKSNTWVLIGSVVTGGGKLARYKCEGMTGGASHAVTVVFSAAAFAVCHFVEIIGSGGAITHDAAASVSTTNTQSAVGATYTITSNALAQANSLVICGAELNGGGTAGAYGFTPQTLLSQEPDVTSFWTSGIGSQNVAATTAVTANITRVSSGGSTSVVFVDAFNEAISATGSLIVDDWNYFDEDVDGGDYSAHDDFTAANRVNVIQPDIIPVPFWIDDELEEDEWAAAQLNPTPADVIQPDIIPIPFWGDDESEEDEWAAAQLNPPPADVIQPDIIPTPFWIDDESEEDEWAALQLTPTPADVIQPDIIPVPLWDFDESEDEEWAALQLNPTPADVISASASLGAFSKFIDGGGTSVPVVTTPAVTTQSTGSSFVIMTLEVPTNIATITDNKGNTYTLTITSAAYSGSFTVNVYVCLNGAGGSGHSGILTKSSGNAVSEVSVFFTEIKNTHFC